MTDSKEDDFDAMLAKEVAAIETEALTASSSSEDGNETNKHGEKESWRIFQMLGLLFLSVLLLTATLTWMEYEQAQRLSSSKSNQPEPSSNKATPVPLVTKKTSIGVNNKKGGMMKNKLGMTKNQSPAPVVPSGPTHTNDPALLVDKTNDEEPGTLIQKSRSQDESATFQYKKIRGNKTNNNNTGKRKHFGMKHGWMRMHSMNNIGSDTTTIQSSKEEETSGKLEEPTEEQEPVEKKFLQGFLDFAANIVASGERNSNDDEDQDDQEQQQLRRRPDNEEEAATRGSGDGGGRV